MPVMHNIHIQPENIKASCREICRGEQSERTIKAIDAKHLA
jgi:hypothetical protein